MALFTIQVWDIAKRRILHTFNGHEQEIYSLDFSRDGRYIVSGSGDKTMRIWDMNDQSGRIVVISDTTAVPAPGQPESDGGVTSVAISPDGTLVAAGSLDCSIRIWDVTSGALVKRLRGHEDSVYSVAFTPDGKGIVSGSLDKKLKFWDITYTVNEFLRSKDGRSSTPSTSTAVDRRGTSPPVTSFVGHRVGLCFSHHAPSRALHFIFLKLYSLTTRILSSLFLSQMMAGGLFRDQRTAAFISGIGTVLFSSCYKVIRILVSP